MNRPSRDPGKEKIVSIRANTLPVVVTMPSRSSHAEGRGAAVLQMPGRFAQEARRAPVVAMPSPSTCRSLRTNRVVEMPDRLNDSEESGETRSMAAWRRRPTRLSLSEGLRMTLVALFALLGWPRPGHPKDPGAAGARPWKLEILNAISNLHLPTPAPVAARACADEHLINADLASAA